MGWRCHNKFYILFWYFDNCIAILTPGVLCLLSPAETLTLRSAHLGTAAWRTRAVSTHHTPVVDRHVQRQLQEPHLWSMLGMVSLTPVLVLV